MKRKLPVILAILLVFLLAGCAPSALSGNLTGNTAPHILSKEEAKEIVFTHANVKAADVTDVDIELDEENGSIYYDLEFDHENKEYDYRVDALSGNILYDKAEPKEAAPQPADTKPAEQAPAETKPASTTTKKKIGVTKAKNAAFKHANVKASDAWDVEVDLDTENGKLVYEVSFDAGGYDYDYDIDAYTGKVLNHKKEKDDDRQAAAKATVLVSPTSKKTIGVDAAKSAAFKHAAVKSGKARDLEVELDDEKGSLLYEVSFDAGGYEYSYDIDAYTGKVVRSEKERND